MSSEIRNHGGGPEIALPRLSGVAPSQLAAFMLGKSMTNWSTRAPGAFRRSTSATDHDKGRSPLRRSSLVLLGAAAGATLSLLITQPTLMSAKAKPTEAAAAQGPYGELERFGKVFELVRAGYVDKTEDSKLIESAINGMLTGLDPHSSYMDAKNYREMQSDTLG